MGVKNEISNFSLYTILAFVQKGMAFFMVPLYVKFLTPIEFGIANEITALGSLYVLIFSFALDEAAVRYYFQLRNNEKEVKRTLGTILVLSVAISIVGSIITLFLKEYTYNYFIPDISYTFIFLISIIIITSPLIAVYQKLLRIQEKGRSFSILTIIYSTIQIVLSILFVAVFKLHELGYLLAFSLPPLLIGVYSFYMLFKEIGFHVYYSQQIASDVLKYSASIIPHTISSWGLRGYTVIAIGKYLNSTLVGIFSAMNFIAIIMDVLFNAFINAYQPWAYKKFESGRDGKVQFVKIAYFIGFSFVLLGFFLSLSAEHIIKIFINSQYYSGIPIAPVLIYVSVVLFLGSLLVFSLYYFKTYTKFLSLSTIIGSLINVVLCMILIPRLGIMGGALSLAISNLAISILKQYFSSKALELRSFFIDLYLIATINAIIAYLAIIYSLNISFKLIIFFVELIIFIVINRKQLIFLKSLIHGQ